MLINTGGRTDIPRFFTPWLLHRLEEGFAYSRNPLYPHLVTRYDLSPDRVDCLLFCSKNYRPLLPHIPQIMRRFNTYFFYTITAYGQDIEPFVPNIDESMETLIELSALVGKKRLVWRYDPIFVSTDYPLERHIATFARMAAHLAPFVDRAVFNFVDLYAKVRSNMPWLLPLSHTEETTLAKAFGAIAEKNALPLQTCGSNEDYSRFGIYPSACVTLARLGAANGIAFKSLKEKGMRAGCHCMESRDIGAYDTCLHGCLYCYANKNPEKARANFAHHDPSSPLLLGHLTDEDTVREGLQKSFLLTTKNAKSPS